MSDPVLSVIIPVWNREQYLAEAITSVLEQQGVPPLEVIVVDDGSEDRSAAVAKGFGQRVRCVQKAHAGLAAARNAGVEIARGRYLLHLDSDDVLPPGSIATRLVCFADSGPDLVVGQMISFVSPDLDRGSAARHRVPNQSQRGGLPGASVVRVEAASRVGGFDVSRADSPDLDWMVRAVSIGLRIVEIPEVVLHRRLHGANMSLRSDGFAADRLAIVRESLNRRRAGRSEPQP